VGFGSFPRHRWRGVANAERTYIVYGECVSPIAYLRLSRQQLQLEKTKMFDDLAATFYNNVIAAYDGYLIHQDAGVSGRNRHLRAAIETANALYHFREHFPSKISREQVEADCPDFQLIADVANAAKHKQIDRRTPLVKSAEDVEEITVITQYEDSDGMYPHAQTKVIVKCTDGSHRNLDAAIINVLNYWSERLRKAGVANYPLVSMPPVLGTRMISREEAKRPDLEALNCIRFKQQIQLMKYDPDKGHSEPVDLTGGRLVMRMYKPAYSIDITFSPEDGSEEVKCALELGPVPN
jgi:hypothetical protein